MPEFIFNVWLSQAPGKRKGDWICEHTASFCFSEKTGKHSFLTNGFAKKWGMKGPSLFQYSKQQNISI